MKAMINTTNMKQKEIIKAVVFSTVIAGYLLYNVGYALGKLIAQIKF